MLKHFKFVILLATLGIGFVYCPGPLHSILDDDEIQALIKALEDASGASSRRTSTQNYSSIPRSPYNQRSSTLNRGSPNIEVIQVGDLDNTKLDNIVQMVGSLLLKSNEEQSQNSDSRRTITERICCDDDLGTINCELLEDHQNCPRKLFFREREIFGLTPNVIKFNLPENITEREWMPSGNVFSNYIDPRRNDNQSQQPRSFGNYRSSSPGTPYGDSSASNIRYENSFWPPQVSNSRRNQPEPRTQTQYGSFNSPLFSDPTVLPTEHQDTRWGITPPPSAYNRRPPKNDYRQTSKQNSGWLRRASSRLDTDPSTFSSEPPRDQKPRSRFMGWFNQTPQSNRNKPAEELNPKQEVAARPPRRSYQRYGSERSSANTPAPESTPKPPALTFSEKYPSFNSHKSSRVQQNRAPDPAPKPPALSFSENYPWLGSQNSFGAQGNPPAEPASMPPALSFSEKYPWLGSQNSFGAQGNPPAEPAPKPPAVSYGGKSYPSFSSQNRFGVPESPTDKPEPNQRAVPTPLRLPNISPLQPTDTTYNKPPVEPEMDSTRGSFSSNSRQLSNTNDSRAERSGLEKPTVQATPTNSPTPVFESKESFMQRINRGERPAFFEGHPVYYQKDEPYKALDLIEFRRETFERHNYYRSKHGLQKYTMIQELNKSAQDYANKLAANNPGGNAMQHSYLPRIGENLYYTPKRRKRLGLLFVDLIWAELEFMNTEETIGTLFSKLNNVDETNITHVVQMLWTDSILVGCGFARSETGSYYTVCHYSEKAIREVQESSINDLVRIYLPFPLFQKHINQAKKLSKYLKKKFDLDKTTKNFGFRELTSEEQATDFDNVDIDGLIADLEAEV